MISHWCKHWFELYPNEPAHFLQIIDEVIKNEDYSLYTNMRSKGLHAKDYAWPNIKQLYSEILHEEDWCILMDIFFAYPDKINLIYYFTAVLVIEHRDVVSGIEDPEELASYDFSA